MTTPAARLTEFVRQARRISNSDPARFYTVNTDLDAGDAVLSLDDLDAVLAQLTTPEPAGDELEELQARIVASIKGTDGTDGAGSDCRLGEPASHMWGEANEYLPIDGNLDIQHLASDLLQDGYGQGIPDLHEAWEAGASAQADYMSNTHLGIDPPANPYNAYKD